MKILLWKLALVLKKIKMLGIVLENAFVLQFFEFIKKMTQIDILCINSSKYLGERYFVYSTVSLMIFKK